jgi:hypothetical protein
MVVQMKLGMGRPMKIFVGVILVIAVLVGSLYVFQWFVDSEGRKIEKLAREIAEQTGGGYEIDPLITCGLENRRTCPSTALFKKYDLKDPEEQLYAFDYSIKKMKDIQALDFSCKETTDGKSCKSTYRSKNNNYIIESQIEKSSTTNTNILSVYVQKDN